MEMFKSIMNSGNFNKFSMYETWGTFDVKRKKEGHFELCFVCYDKEFAFYPKSSEELLKWMKSSIWYFLKNCSGRSVINLLMGLQWREGSRK